ncbi:MAG: hypothetical protein AAFY15_06650 [Cyanobacteria bacterium J06648_11]
MDIDYDIERQGNRLIVTPLGCSFDGTLDLFAAFSDDFMAEGRPEQGTQKT